MCSNDFATSISELRSLRSVSENQAGGLEGPCDQLQGLQDFAVGHEPYLWVLKDAVTLNHDLVISSYLEMGGKVIRR